MNGKGTPVTPGHSRTTSSSSSSSSKHQYNWSGGKWSHDGGTPCTTNTTPASTPTLGNSTTRHRPQPHTPRKLSPSVRRRLLTPSSSPHKKTVPRRSCSSSSPLHWMTFCLALHVTVWSVYYCHMERNTASRSTLSASFPARHLALQQSPSRTSRSQKSDSRDLPPAAPGWTGRVPMAMWQQLPHFSWQHPKTMTERSSDDDDDNNYDDGNSVWTKRTGGFYPDAALGHYHTGALTNCTVDRRSGNFTLIRSRATSDSGDSDDDDDEDDDDDDNNNNNNNNEETKPVTLEWPPAVALPPQRQATYTEGILHVSCRPLTYRLVEDSFRPSKGGTSYNTIMVGVLSSASGVSRRKTIRDTWARGGNGATKIFFMVAGPWEDIATEFFQYGDLIWLDMEEHYDSITEKTAAFMYLVEHVSSYLGVHYEFAMKTDDDSYVALDRLEERIRYIERTEKQAVDYWGMCAPNQVKPLRGSSVKWSVTHSEYPQDHYSRYCLGGGYLLSRRFLSCAEHHIPFVRYIGMEDVYTGFLSERCGITSFYDENHSSLLRIYRAGWDSELVLVEIDRARENRRFDPSSKVPAEMGGRIVQHHVVSDGDMRAYDQSYRQHKRLRLKHIAVGDAIEYYRDAWHWLPATVIGKRVDEHGDIVVTLHFQDGLEQEYAFDDTFSGRYRRSVPEEWAES